MQIQKTIVKCQVKLIVCKFKSKNKKLYKIKLLGEAKQDKKYEELINNALILLKAINIVINVSKIIIKVAKRLISTSYKILKKVAKIIIVPIKKSLTYLKKEISILKMKIINKINHTKLINEIMTTYI